MIISIPHTGTRFLKKFFREAGRDVHNEHIRVNNPYPQILARLSKDDPIIIPLRDPAMNFLSFHQRRHTASLFDVAKDWRFMTEKLNDAVFIPLDADHDLSGKIELLTRCLDVEKIDASSKYLVEYATEWPKVGTEGATDAKEAYLKGDMGALNEMAPNVVHALNTIKDIGHWFRQHGYKEFAWER